LSLLVFSKDLFILYLFWLPVPKWAQNNGRNKKKIKRTLELGSNHKHAFEKYLVCFSFAFEMIIFLFFYRKVFQK
jgi:hypothetical protein